MELLLVRHARAEEREVFAISGADDALRPLTREGAARMRDVAAGLHRLLPDLDIKLALPDCVTYQGKVFDGSG